MAKSTKIFTLITIFVLLLALGLTATFGVDCQNTAFANAVERVTVNISVKKGDTPVPFDLAAIILLPDDGSEPSSTSATATRTAEGEYSMEVDKQYGDGGREVYNIFYKVTATDASYQNYGKVSTYNPTVEMQFYTITQEDYGTTTMIIAKKDSTTPLAKVSDVKSSGSLAGDVLFAYWTLENPYSDPATVLNQGTVTANRDKKYVATRIAIDRSWFKVSDSTILTVRGADSNAAIQGTIEYADQSSLFTQLNNVGDTTKTIEFFNSTITQTISVPTGAETTIKGSFTSTKAAGIFDVQGGKLVLDGAKISATDNTRGIVLDTGELVLQGEVNTGGIIVTDQTATNGTLTFAEGVSTETTISLSYKDLDYNLNKNTDTNANLLRVDGETASKFTLSNANNQCGMQYNATTGTLYLEEKFYLKYELTTGVSGTAPAIQYVMRGTTVSILGDDGISKKGHDFLYWHAIDGTIYREGDNYSPIADLTLRSYFAPRQYTIAFEDVTMTPVTHTYGTATDITTPSKLGFTFEHWLVGDQKVASQNGKITIGAEQYDSATVRTIAYKAVWKLKSPTAVSANNYTAQYDGQPHEIAVTAQHELNTVLFLTTWSGPSGTTGDLFVKNVADSGEYTCKVTAYVKDTATNKWYYSDGVNISATVEIAKITLKIAADPAEKEEGDPDPEFSFTITEGTMAAGETPKMLGAKLTREAGEEKGTYKIAFSYTNSNYFIYYKTANLTIKQKNLILIIVLPSVFGGLAIIGGSVALTIILIKRRKKQQALAKIVDQTPTAPADETTTPTEQAQEVDKDNAVSNKVEKEKRPRPKNKSKKKGGKK